MSTWPMLVIIESPYGSTPDGDRANAVELARNVEYAKAAMRDCFERSEVPYASHLLYPQVYDDANAEEREAGMRAGWEWMRCADLVAVYTDLGKTPGMRAGIERAYWMRIRVEERQLSDWKLARR